MKTSTIAATLFILLASTSLFAQKSKRVEIYKNKTFKDYVDVHYYYDENNEITDKLVILFGQDLRYKQLTQVATIYGGTPKDFIKFMDDVEKFFKENEEDFSTSIDGRRMVTVKMFGIKGFNLYEKDKLGYRSYNLKTWGKIRKAVVAWAKKNNEPLE